MSAPTHPTHTHYTQYADPVVRHPSPASSVGTTYDPDQTSFSDSEAQISQAAFERKRELEIELHLPRKEEVRAERDPLLSVWLPAPGNGGAGAGAGKPIRYGERKLEPHEEKLVFERIMETLRAEVAQLEEDEQFEEILLRGSRAALEMQPVTNDIDALMRSMMGPGMDIGGAHMGRAGEQAGQQQQQQRWQRQQRQGEMANGPWNNFGEGPRESVLGVDSFLSGTTAGKRSRNGTSRKL